MGMTTSAGLKSLFKMIVWIFLAQKRQAVYAFLSFSACIASFRFKSLNAFAQARYGLGLSKAAVP